MAVYRHIRDKEALLGALCDALLADLDPFDSDRPWRPQVERFAQQMRDALAGRPSLAAVLATAPVTPSAVALTQQAIVVMTNRGVPLDVAAGGLSTVFAYVIGFAVTEASLPDAAQDQDELRRSALQHLGDPATEPPHLDTALHLVQTPADFSFGLDLILDGLERLATRSSTTADAQPPAQAARGSAH
jgi:AcrR family transcriptional regulator